LVIGCAKTVYLCFFSGWAYVLRIAESKDREEYNRQKNHAYRKSFTLAKAFGHQVPHPNYEDKVDTWANHEQTPPNGFTHDFTHNNIVIDWNNGCPSWLTGFGKYSPQRGDNQDADRDKKNNHARPHVIRAGIGIPVTCFHCVVVLGFVLVD
jgi:hypothetical protein